MVRGQIARLQYDLLFPEPVPWPVVGDPLGKADDFRRVVGAVTFQV